MFEILTWNQNQAQQRKISKSKSKGHQVRCCECSRQCNQNSASPKKDQAKHQSRSMNQSQKKIKQDQLKKHSNQSHQNKNTRNSTGNGNERVEQKKSPKGVNIKNQNHLVRPKSAANLQKTTKTITSPVKKSRVIPKPQQIEQNAVQDKQKLIEKFKQTTRWIPNSAFTTYFGKPAFENYGRCNTNPAFGGLMYGNYLKTHNIQPHRGVNSPKSIQCYNIALQKAQAVGAIYPYPPKVSKKQNLAFKQNQGSIQKTQIYPETNNYTSLPVHAPNLYNLQKFGGKGIQKVSSSKFERSYVQKENDSRYVVNENGNGKNSAKVQIGNSRRYDYEGIKY